MHQRMSQHGSMNRSQFFRAAAAVTGGVMLSCAAAVTLQRVWILGYEATASVRVAHVPEVLDATIESRAMVSPAVIDEVVAAIPKIDARVMTAGFPAPALWRADAAVSPLTLREGLKVSATDSPEVVDLSLTMRDASTAEKGLTTLIQSHQSRRASLLPAGERKLLASAIAQRRKASESLGQFDRQTAAQRSQDVPGDTSSQRKLLEERSDALRREADRRFAEASGFSQACDEIEKRMDDFSDTVVTSRWHGPDPVVQSLRDKMVEAQVELTKARSQYLPNTPPVRNAQELVETLHKQLESVGDAQRDVCTLDEMNPAKREMSLRLEKTRIDLATSLATARHATAQAREIDGAIAKLDEAQMRVTLSSIERTPIEREVAFWDDAIDAARSRMLRMDQARDSFAVITPVSAAAPVRASMGWCALLTSPIGLLTCAFPLIRRRNLDDAQTVNEDGIQPHE